MQRKKLLFLWLAAILHMSLIGQRQITGTVTNATDNSGMPGVTIVIEGTSAGTRTDGEGKYKLNVPEKLAGSTLKLKATFLGYKTKFTTLSATNNTADFSMAEDKLMLDEVVVTAQAIKREKRSLGYGTVTVRNEELTQGGATSALTGLQGKTTGATINNVGGTPGSSTSIVLRGPKSFTGNNQALIVVDGVPINNSSFQNDDNLNNSVDFGNRLNDINPNDIESITVLKGAEGAVTYGSLASNGVIVITTKSAKKSGKKGSDFGVTINSNARFQSPLMLPELQTKFGQGGNGLYDSRENWSWGPALDGVIRPWGNPVMLADENGNMVSQIRVKPFSAIKDNLRNAFNTGKLFTNDIALTKSFEKADVYFSYQNTHQEGIVPNTGLDKNSFRLNLNSEIRDNLRLGVNFNYINTSIENSIQGQSNSSFYDNVLQTPVDISYNELKDLNNPFNNITNYYGAYTYNPYQMVEYNRAKSNVNRFITNATISYNPISWLTLTNRFGLDNYTDSRNFQENKFTNTNQHPTQSNSIGKYAEEIYQNTLINNDIMASVSQNITKDLKYNVMAGFNVFSDKLKTTSAQTAGLAIPNFYNLSNSDGRPSNENEELNRLKYGIYGSFDVDYKNYFFFSVMARQDWSSTLPAEKRSYFYPSVNSSFVFTELWKDKTITFGKIRASWSQVGKDAPINSLNTVNVPYDVTDGFQNTNVKTPFIGSNGTTQVAGYSQSNNAGNPELRPEMITSWEIGTELGFFEDRASLDMNINGSETNDGIIRVDVAPSTGYSTRWINAGRMTNFGFEVMLKALPIVRKNFKLEVNWNYTNNKNTVTQVYPNVKQLSLGGINGASVYVDSGSAYGTFYVNSYDRSPDGQIVVDATSGLPVASGKLMKSSTYLPDYTMGFGLTATIFKRLKAAITFDYSKGGVFYSRTKDIVEFLGSGVTTELNNRQDYVLPNTVNLVGGVYVPNTTPVFLQDYFTQGIAEDYMVDRTFFKLRELSLSYSFPVKASWNKYVKSIDLSLFGNNLLLWIPESNKYVDPEINSFGTTNVQGIDFSNIPSVRAIGANLRLSF